jgi:hypothetical protein
MAITAKYSNAGKTNVNVTLEPGDHLASLNVQAEHTIPGYTIPAHTVPSFVLDGVTYPARDVPAEDVPEQHIPAGKTTTYSVPCDDANPVWVALKALVDAGEVVIADFEPPPPTVVEEISDRQFFQQLAIEGDITEDEALAAVQTGAIPSDLQAVIATLPADQQFNARMLLAGATVFKFSNPLTAALAAALTPPRTTEQMQALWASAAKLV